MRFSRRKEINDKARELVRAGWAVMKRGAHYRIQHPAGATLTIPGTPSDYRAVLNFHADARRIERAGGRCQGGYVLSIFVMLPVCILVALIGTWVFMTLFYFFFG